AAAAVTSASRRTAGRGRGGGLPGFSRWPPPAPPPRNRPPNGGATPRWAARGGGGGAAGRGGPRPRGRGRKTRGRPPPAGGGWWVAAPWARSAVLLARPANAVGFACELDGAGVGQVLALPRHRRHDQPTEKRSHQAQHKYAQAHQHQAATGTIPSRRASAGC